MEVLAKPWTGLLIMTLEDGPLRFSEIAPRVGAIGDRMLSLRLRELEAHGLVHRKVMPGPPVRVEYTLTEVGRGFREVSVAVSRWGHAIVEAKTAAQKAQKLAAHKAAAQGNAHGAAKRKASGAAE